MKASLRAYVVRHEDGHVTATLMRHRERLFGPPAPTAFATSIEEACRYLEDVLRARLLDGTEGLPDYLFEGEVRHEEVAVDVHPMHTVQKTPVIADTPVTLRLGYAIFALPRGGFRVMMPRFGWWFVCETRSSAPALIRQLVSADLLGQSGRGLHGFRHGASESILERQPSWARRERPPPSAEETDAAGFPELSKVAEEWVTAARRRRLPVTVGALAPAHLALAEAEPFRSLVLVGPSGTGKTAWVRQLARHFATLEKTTERRRRLWSTSAERMVSGLQYLGEWQARVLSLVNELVTGDDLFFVDHIGAFTRPQPGGGAIADFFVGPIRQGTIRLVLEADPREWQHAQRSHPELTSELTVLRFAEPPDGEIPTLLRAYQERRAPHVVIHGDGYRRLVSHLRIATRTSAFPGKGFRFLEALCPDPEREKPRTLRPRDVSEAFARVTGLPVALVADEERRDEASFAALLSAQVIGQDAACRTVASLLTRFKAGLADPERPLGVLLFVGPTGVGKTELAKQIARVMLGDEKRLVRLDMSEYGLAGSSARLLEAGRGTSLAARVRQQPFAVVLFDEIEKAHPEIFDLLLGITGEGRLTDTSGREVDFRSTVIVMTSNLGAGEGARVGFDETPAPTHARRVREAFRPELVARFDDVVAFDELAPESVRCIVDLMLDEVRTRTGLTLRAIRLEVTDAARALLARHGHAPGKGARALSRVIEEEVVSRIGAELSAEPSLVGTTFVLDVVVEGAPDAANERLSLGRGPDGGRALDRTPR